VSKELHALTFFAALAAVIVGFGVLGYLVRDAFDWKRVWLAGTIVVSAVAVVGFLSGWSPFTTVLAPIAWGSFFATAGRTLVGWQGEK